jgi:hypothetical protein
MAAYEDRRLRVHRNSIVCRLLRKRGIPSDADHELADDNLSTAPTETEGGARVQLRTAGMPSVQKRGQSHNGWCAVQVWSKGGKSPDRAMSGTRSEFGEFASDAGIRTSAISWAVTRCPNIMFEATLSIQWTLGRTSVTSSSAATRSRLDRDPSCSLS